MSIASFFRSLGSMLAPPQQSFSQPTTDDLERLQEQLAVVQSMLTEHYPGAALHGSTADLALLQRILDDQLLHPGQTYELQCLGIAFGSILAEAAGLHWIVVEDQYGRD